jgi:hypothetical protein
MKRRSEPLAAMLVLVTGLMVAVSAPVAAATNQVSGVGSSTPRVSAQILRPGMGTSLS